MAEVLALEILIDESMIDDYIVNETHQNIHNIQMNVIGLTWFSLYRGDLELTFEGLVVEDECMNVEIIGGAPFMEVNDISVRPSRRLITFSDDSVFRYGCQYVLQVKGCDIQVMRAYHVSKPRFLRTENKRRKIGRYGSLAFRARWLILLSLQLLLSQFRLRQKSNRSLI